MFHGVPEQREIAFILPRLFMVYASKTTTHDTADWEL